jgi:hypothetical protein
MICPRCASANLPTAPCCSRCGNALTPVLSGLNEPTPSPHAISSLHPGGGSWPSPVLGCLALGQFALVVTTVAWNAWQYHVAKSLLFDLANVALALPLFIAGMFCFRANRAGAPWVIGMSLFVLGVPSPPVSNLLAWVLTIAIVLAALTGCVADADLRMRLVPSGGALSDRKPRVIGIVALAAIGVLMVGPLALHGRKTVNGYDFLWNAHPAIVLVALGLAILGLFTRPGTGGIGITLGVGVLVASDSLAALLAQALYGEQHIPIVRPMLWLLTSLIAIGVASNELAEDQPAVPETVVTSLQGATMTRDYPNNKNEQRLATPGQRFGANVIDVLIGIIPLVALYAGLIGTASTSKSYGGKANGAPLLAGLVIGFGGSLAILIWHILCWKTGQSPGKKAMKLHVASATTGKRLGTGEMAVRELVFRGLVVGLLNGLTCGLGGIVAAAMVWSDRRQTLWDRMAKTVVVSDAVQQSAATNGLPPTYRPQISTAEPPPAVPTSASPLEQWHAPASLPTTSALAPLLSVPPSIAQVAPASDFSHRPTPDAQISAPFIDDDGSRTMRAVPGLRWADSPVVAVPAIHQIRLDDGRTLNVDAVILLGRNPSPESSDSPQTCAVAVDDPDRSISKTHLAIGASNGMLWIQDRHSTNGVTISVPGQATCALVPGEQTTLTSGTTIAFGSRSAVVL